MEEWVLTSFDSVKETVVENRVWDAYFGFTADFYVTYLKLVYHYTVTKVCTYIDPETGKPVVEKYPPINVDRPQPKLEVWSKPVNPIIDFLVKQGVSVVIGQGGVSIGTGTYNYSNDINLPGKTTFTDEWSYTAELADVSTNHESELELASVGVDPGSPLSTASTRIDPSFSITISTPESLTLRGLMNSLVPNGGGFTNWDSFNSPLTVSELRSLAVDIGGSTGQQMLSALTGYSGDSIVVVTVTTGRTDVKLERY